MSNQIESADTLRIVRCRVGDEIYGLDMSWVVNIQRVDRLRRVSDKGTGDTGFIGWLSDRQNDIPVFSMAKRLGYTAPSTQNQSLNRIIILPAPVRLPEAEDENENLWALMVDQVSQVIEVTKDRFEPMPTIAVNPQRNYFEGVIKLDESLILFLSPEWLHPDTALYTEGVMEEPYQLEAKLNAQTMPAQHSPSEQSQTTPKSPKRNGTAPKTTQAGQEQHSPGQLIVFSTRQPDVNEPIVAYGLSITQIPEILRPLPILPIPAAPDYVLGLVNWRDRVVPVVDLDARMGLRTGGASPTNGHSRLIIARGVDETLVSFPIQPSVRALRLPVPHGPARQMPEIDKTFVRGVVELEDLTLVVPNIQDMLS